MHHLDSQTPLGSYRGWRLFAYPVHQAARGYALAPGLEDDSQQALTATADCLDELAGALVQAIDDELARSRGA
jgi:hypothetical protein